MHRLYKVRGIESGQLGRFFFTNGVSQWLNKTDADSTLGSVGVRSNGETDPYFAILEFDSIDANIPLPENYDITGTWQAPKPNRIIMSEEAKRMMEQKQAAASPVAEKPARKRTGA